VRGETHPSVAAEVAGTLHAAFSCLVTGGGHKGGNIPIVVDARRTAGTDHTATTLASSGVVVGSVFVCGRSGAHGDGSRAHTANNARLVGELSAGLDATGRDVVTVSLTQPRADTLGHGRLLSVSHSILLFLCAGSDAALACRVKVATTGQTADTHVGVGRKAVGTHRVTGALECVEGNEHVGGALENFKLVALERKGAI